MTKSFPVKSSSTSFSKRSFGNLSNKKKKMLSESGRRTRGKKITFEAEESGEDSLDEEAARKAANQTNKKKRKKDKSDTDMDEDDYVSEPEESEDEEDSD